MPYPSVADLPAAVRRVLPPHAQDIWRNAWNRAYAESHDEGIAARVAWSAVRRAGYRRGADGRWHRG